MKVAVSSMTDQLNSKIDPHFIRAKHFIIVDTDSDYYQPLNLSDLKFKDIVQKETTQKLVNSGVDALITSDYPKNAWNEFHEAGIEVFENRHGSVIENIKAFKNDQIKQAKRDTDNSQLKVPCSIDTQSEWMQIIPGFIPYKYDKMSQKSRHHLERK